MKKQATFKVEAEIVIEYNVPDGCPSDPYVQMSCAVNKDGNLEVVSMVGTIKDGTLLSLKRVNE